MCVCVCVCVHLHVLYINFVLWCHKLRSLPPKIILLYIQVLTKSCIQFAMMPTPTHLILIFVCCLCLRTVYNFCTCILCENEWIIDDFDYTISDCKVELQRLAFVQYGFDRKEHSIDIKPHGNSKKQRSFRRTKPSTLKLVKKAVKENKRPLQVLREVENIQGGVMNAKSGSDLPRNRQQMYSQKLHLEMLSPSFSIDGIILKEVVYQLILSHYFMPGFASSKLRISSSVSFQEYDPEVVQILAIYSQPIVVNQLST